jgi:rhamnosyltransferase
VGRCGGTGAVRRLALPGMGHAVSVIVRCRDKADTIEATFASIRAQTVPSEVVVVDSGSTDGTLEIARSSADVLVEIAPHEFSFGRALNVGAAAAHGTVHAALSAHTRFPRDDWLERALDHLRHDDVAGASGSLDRPDGRPLLEPFYQGAADWVAGWGFSNTAAAWRASVWRDHRFNEDMTASEDKEWAWRVILAGWRIAFDPLLVVPAGHRRGAGVRDLLRRSSAETSELVSHIGMPPVGAREALASWWSEIVRDEQTPPMLQRLNYYRLTEILGSYIGSRQAIPRTRAPEPAGEAVVGSRSIRSGRASSPAISMILTCRREPQRLRRTIASVLEQGVTVEIVGVVAPQDRDATRAVAPEIDVLVDLDTAHWTPGRALNAGAAAATAPIHATVRTGRELPSADWLERILAHHRRPEVAGASGARFAPEGGLLLEARDVREADWTPTWAFSTAAAGWRATAWASRPFHAAAPAAEDLIWAWEVLRSGHVLVVDPFLQLEGPPDEPPRASSILRRTADDWASLIGAGTPVIAPSVPQALAGWWAEIDSASATPPALQRLNYFRLARALGRWLGGRRARRGLRQP